MDRLLTFPHDEILAIENEIYHVTDVKYNMLDSDDDKMIIRATVLAKVDDNDIMTNFAAAYKNRGDAYKELGDNAKAEADNAKSRELCGF